MLINAWLKNCLISKIQSIIQIKSNEQRRSCNKKFQVHMFGNEVTVDRKLRISTMFYEKDRIANSWKSDLTNLSWSPCGENADEAGGDW